MDKQYAPREFMLHLENVDLQEISDETLFFVKGKEKKIKAVVSTDLENEIVHVAPVSPIYEDVEYWIMFSEALHFANGNPFPKDYYIRFVVRDGYCYATRDSLLPIDDSFFEPENILSPRLVMNVPFHEPGTPPLPSAAPPQPSAEQSPYVRAATKRRGAWKLLFLLIPLFLLALAVVGLVFLRNIGFLPLASFKDDSFLLNFSASSIKTRARYTGISNDDTISELVTAAGGNGNGVLRASLLWNNGQDNLNDYDLICIEPDGNRIFFGSTRSVKSGGALDVDVIYPEQNMPAVENIAWGSTADMQEGSYTFFVCNYSERNGSGGFKAEIAFGRESYAFTYDHKMAEHEVVKLGECTYSPTEGFKLLT